MKSEPRHGQILLRVFVVFFRAVLLQAGAAYPVISLSVICISLSLFSLNNHHSAVLGGGNAHRGAEKPGKVIRRHISHPFADVGHGDGAVHQQLLEIGRAHV